MLTDDIVVYFDSPNTRRLDLPDDWNEVSISVLVPSVCPTKRLQTRQNTGLGLDVFDTVEPQVARHEGHNFLRQIRKHTVVVTISLPHT